MRPRVLPFLALALLAMAGCGSPRQSSERPGVQAAHTGQISATDGAMAVFRAKVTPILCAYAADLRGVEEDMNRASTDAGGPINASAPESAQAEYINAMRNFSGALQTALDGFRSVTAPPELADAYRGFVASLGTASGYADRVAEYAMSGNYAGIAAMENVSIPTAGEGVFRTAGITDCQVRTP